MNQLTHWHRLLPAALTITLAGAGAGAAPLDALLSVHHAAVPGTGEVELGYDMMNSTLDVLKLREDSGAASSVGDYQGAHLRGGVAVTSQLWIDGALWKRKIDYRSVVAELTAWQVAGQYKVLDGAGAVPAVAVRVGAWGNYADALTKWTNTSVAGTKFTSATVSGPKDTQLQLDVIGSWALSASSAVSVFTSAGKSRVTFDAVSATSRSANGCEYDIAFSEAGATATLAQPCSAKVVITRFTQPANATVDVYKEAQYDASYLQAGLMADWHSMNWRARAGYQYQTIRRDNVDDIIASRGATPYKHNHVLIGDISYNAYQNIVVFVRGQFMSNQFNGEVPLAYNSLTADKYHQKYGIVSTGLSLVF